jgi:cell cycle sensor histidine kinase DivJ
VLDDPRIGEDRLIRLGTAGLALPLISGLISASISTARA